MYYWIHWTITKPKSERAANRLETAFKIIQKKKKKENIFQTESSNILKMMKIKTEHLHHCQWFPSITCEAFFGFGLQRDVREELCQG